MTGDVKGIPINALLKKLSEQSSSAERHKFYPRVAVKNTDIHTEEDVDSIKNYVESIEKDFASSAQNVLDQMNLSHLMTRKKR